MVFVFKDTSFMYFVAYKWNKGTTLTDIFNFMLDMSCIYMGKSANNRSKLKVYDITQILSCALFVIIIHLHLGNQVQGCASHSTSYSCHTPGLKWASEKQICRQFILTGQHRLFSKTMSWIFVCPGFHNSGFVYGNQDKHRIPTLVRLIRQKLSGVNQNVWWGQKYTV